MTDEQQIQQLIESWAAAVRSRDLDGILAHHSPDMVMFDVPPPFQSIGIDAYRQTWEIFFKYTRTGVFTIHGLQIVASDRVAFGIATMQCEDSTGGTGFQPLDFRLTVGLRKINDEWTIVHEHHSIPSE